MHFFEKIVIQVTLDMSLDRYDVYENTSKDCYYFFKYNHRQGI